jgi:hypothetical protein
MQKVIFSVQLIFLFVSYSCSSCCPVVGGIPYSCLISAGYFPDQKSALIISFVSKVETSLVLLAFSFDFADMGTEFIAEIK